MTAFSAVESVSTLGTLRMELRAVNHRYLELGFKLPEELRSVEGALRAKVQERVQRGKLDLSMRWRPATAAGGALKVNQALVDGILATLDRWQEAHPRLHTPDALSLLAFPGVLEHAETDHAALQAQVLAACDELLAQFDAHRQREGDQLVALIRDRARQIGQLREQAIELQPRIRQGQREKLEQRIADLKQPLDPGRVEQELVLFLQKLDVDEELDRLGVHLKELERTLAGKDAVGRRLDFLLQEFNREANTFGSKSVDPRSSQLAIEFKVLIEQIREQVQNLE